MKFNKKKVSEIGKTVAYWSKISIGSVLAVFVVVFGLFKSCKDVYEDVRTINSSRTESCVEALEHLIEKREEKILNARTDVLERGYILYLDGVEVDINNLDIRCYSITIDDIKKKVFLAR